MLTAPAVLLVVVALLLTACNPSTPLLVEEIPAPGSTEVPKPTEAGASRLFVIPVEHYTQV